MRRFKINRKQLKRLNMNGNDMKNGYLSSAFWKDLRNNTSAIMDQPWSETKKATMLAILSLSEDGTKPIKMDKKNLKIITMLVRTLLRAPVEIQDVRKLVGSK